MKSLFIAAPLLVLGASALPSSITKRAVNDTTVLNFALTLEHLESAYYSQGLANFSQADFDNAGLPAFARGRFAQVAEHEKAHVALLQSVLGPEATKPCTYNFPVTDAKSFVALATALEGVGVSAYSGAAQLLTSKALLTAAATILSTEARHAAWIQSAVLKGSPWSGNFDVALGINEVFTLAAAFIASCPSTNPPLPVKAFPSLSVASPKPGSASTFSFTPASGASTSGSLFVAFFSGPTPAFAPLKDGKATIPADLRGVVYAVVTNNGSSTADENVLAGPAILNFDFNSHGDLV